MTTAQLNWDLHTAEIAWPEAGTIIGDIALAQGDAGVYFVMLVTLADEHEALHDAVFLPAVDALAPEVLTEVRPTATPAAPLAEGATPIDTRVRSTDGMVMVYVPSGEFEMGNTGIQWIWGGSLRDGDLGALHCPAPEPTLVALRRCGLSLRRPSPRGISLAHMLPDWPISEVKKTRRNPFAI